MHYFKVKSKIFHYISTNWEFFSKPELLEKIYSDWYLQFNNELWILKIDNNKIIDGPFPGGNITTYFYKFVYINENENFINEDKNQTTNVNYLDKIIYLTNKIIYIHNYKMIGATNNLRKTIWYKETNNK